MTHMAERLTCPSCGFDDVEGLVVGHPRGFAGGVAVAIEIGLPCCGHVHDGPCARYFGDTP